MSAYKLPTDYRVPAVLEVCSDEQRAAFLDGLAATCVMAQQMADKQADSLAARYEERLAEQGRAFDRAMAAATGHASNEVTARLDELSARLDPIDRIFNGSLSSAKGRYSEEFIMSYLSTGRYAAGRVEFMAKTTGQGDLWYVNAAGQTILIEIKNKRVITAEDIEKFDRDVRAAYEQGQISAALFISLDAQRFPSLASDVLNYRMISGCPTIHAFIEQLGTLDVAISALETIVTHTAQCSAVAFQAANAVPIDTGAELVKMKKIRSTLESSLAVVKARIAELSERLSEGTAENKGAAMNALNVTFEANALNCDADALCEVAGVGDTPKPIIVQKTRQRRASTRRAPAVRRGKELAENIIEFIEPNISTAPSKLSEPSLPIESHECTASDECPVPTPPSALSCT